MPLAVSVNERHAVVGVSLPPAFQSPAEITTGARAGSPGASPGRNTGSAHAPGGAIRSHHGSNRGSGYAHILGRNTPGPPMPFAQYLKLFRRCAGRHRPAQESLRAPAGRHCRVPVETKTPATGTPTRRTRQNEQPPRKGVPGPRNPSRFRERNSCAGGLSCAMNP